MLNFNETEKNYLKRISDNHTFHSFEYGEDIKSCRSEEVLKTIFNEIKINNPELLNNKEFMFNAVILGDGYPFVFASDDLKKDKELILEAIKNFKDYKDYKDLGAYYEDNYIYCYLWYPLNHASKELKNDKEVVLTAVKQNGNALEYASDELKETQFYSDLKDAIKNDTLDTFNENTNKIQFGE